MAKPISAVDITAIANYGGLNFNRLLGDMYLKSDITRTMTPITNLTAPRTINKMSITNGLRQLNTAIESAKGRRSFVPRTITPRGAMKIVEVIPEQYRDTFLAEQLAEDAKDIPFAAFIWMKEAEKVVQEYLLAFYNNKYVAPTAYSAATVYTAGQHILFDDVVYVCLSTTTAGQSPETTPAKWADDDANVLFDGPGTIVAAEITGGALVPVVTGAISSTNAVEKFKLMFNSQPQEVRDSGTLIIHCSYDHFQNYQEDYNTRYGSGQGIGGADLDTVSSIVLRGSAGRCRIQPCKWMGGSNRLIITPKTNLWFGYNNNPENVGLGTPVPTLHGFKTAMKTMSGFQFGDISLIGVNDQA